MLDKMTELYGEWLKSQGLPERSADELLYSEDLTEHQRQWLSGFSLMWEAQGRIDRETK